MRINPPIAQTRDKVNYAGTSTGSANTQLLSGVTAYQDGMIIKFQAGYTNTGAATLNGKAVQIDGVALTANQIQVNEILEARYNAGTNTFQILRPRVMGIPDNLFPNPKVINLGSTTPRGAGDNDIYTPPAGRRYVYLGGTLSQITGSAINVKLQRKKGGTYYPFAGTTSHATSTNIAMGSADFVFDENNILSLNTSATGVTIVDCLILEFDATSPLKSVALDSVASGNQTIYTAPAGFTAFAVQAVNSLAPTVLSTNVVKFFNSSGSIRTIYWNVVKSGGSVLAPGASGSNALTFAAVAATNNNSYSNGFGTVVACGSGDFVNLNSDSAIAGQHAWINLIETPA